MKLALLVGIGGCLGSISRWKVTEVLERSGILSGSFGTFFVNVIGCFFIGCLAAKFYTSASGESPFFAGMLTSQQASALLISGLLGGFTTYSNFAWETIVIARDESLLLAACYLLGTVITGLLTAFLGFQAASC